LDVKKTFDENFNFDIFEQIANINELVKELVIRELLILQHYQVDPKELMSFSMVGKT
jgi:hypothetical protein